MIPVRRPVWIVWCLTVLWMGCRTPQAVREPADALREVSVDAWPAFADDAEYEGFDTAIGHSLTALGRQNPARTLAFGRHTATVAHVIATLERLRQVTADRPRPDVLRERLRAEFRVFRSVGNGRDDVLFTGYYLPRLRASRTRQGSFQTPLYGLPSDLVLARGADFPQLKGEDLVGRLRDGRLEPYPDRAAIRGGALDGRGLEIAWVDSPIDAFFLEIQGSGELEFPDGARQVATFAGKNGRAYVPIGRELLRRGALPPGGVSMQSIRAWLEGHPDDRDGVFDLNPSHVFFRLSDAALGSLGVPVTPGRSVAADPRVFPAGAPVFVQTEVPDAGETGASRQFSRWMLHQDAGGAIRTSGRVDLYLGPGPQAAEQAGRLQHHGALYYLLLRDPPP